MSIRVYKYGCRSPDSAARIVKQMEEANRYRNRLVEIELQRRKETDIYLLANNVPLVEVEAELSVRVQELDEAIAAMKSANAKARRKVATAETKATIKSLQAKLNAAYALRKHIRASIFADPDRKAALDEISQRAKAAIRDARKKCGLYWGTYLLVEDAASAFGKGPPPRFQGWCGDGRIGVQIQNGITWIELLAGEDTRLRLVRNSDVRHADVPPGERTAAKYYTLWMRIGSKDRAPIWTKVPAVIHRQPPENAIVKLCVLHRRVIGGEVKWNVTFTLDMDATKPTGLHVVGIDVGYRVMPNDTQRIAVAIGSDGERHELTLPTRIIGAFSNAEGIASYRDKQFNAIVERLKSWLAAAERPAWLVERLNNLASWQSKRRLVKVIREWQNRSDVPNDEEIVAALDEWASRDEHLNRYENLSRNQSQNARQDIYRKWVAMLRKRYAVAVIENMNLNDAIYDVMRPPFERDTVTPQRRIARWAAISTLVEAIKQSGIDVISESPGYTTCDCHSCRGRCAFDAENKIRHTCEHCGVEWDQDDNAARNLLARGVAILKTRASLAVQGRQGVASNGDVAAKPSRYEIRSAARKRQLAAKPSKELR